MERKDVYVVLDGERDYQDSRWNADTTVTEGKHSVAEFALFMDDYLREARTQLSRNGEPEASQMALDTLRKVVGMGIACFEQHGVPARYRGPLERIASDLRKGATADDSDPVCPTCNDGVCQC